MRVFLFLCIFVWALPAAAQSERKFCDKAKNTHDLVQCLSTEYELLQKSYTVRFEKTLKAQNEQTADSFQAAQKDWIIYRNSECRWEAQASANESLKRLQELLCLIRVTDNRVQALAMIEEPAATQREAQGFNPRWMNVMLEQAPETYWQMGSVWEQDLDCDGHAERVVTGLSYTAAGQDDGLVLSRVFALATSTETGRAETNIFTLKAAQDQETLCPVQLRTQPVMPMVDDGAQSDVADQNAQCVAKDIIIDMLDCGVYKVAWDDAGQDYILQALASPVEDTGQ